MLSKQPLFKTYQANQPFNSNHLKPCPMLENQRSLYRWFTRQALSQQTLQSPEPVEHLCGKCENYAAEWDATADKLWEEGHLIKVDSDEYKELHKND